MNCTLLWHRDSDIAVLPLYIVHNMLCFIACRPSCFVTAAMRLQYTADACVQYARLKPDILALCRLVAMTLDCSSKVPMSAFGGC